MLIVIRQSAIVQIDFVEEGDDAPSTGFGYDHGDDRLSKLANYTNWCQCFNHAINYCGIKPEQTIVTNMPTRKALEIYHEFAKGNPPVKGMKDYPNIIKMFA